MASDPTKPRVLCVDDDPIILDTLRVCLKEIAEVVAVQTAEQGLQAIHAGPAFAAIISDMRMPSIDGATFLSRARYEAPATIRMLLTGDADLNAAVTAVNQGYIFRFLLKPVRADVIRAAVAEAVSHYNLATAERDDLYNLVFKDDLTNLNNRRYFNSVHPKEHARCQRHGRTYSLVFIDLDGVKAVNSEYGHIAGSRVIEQAATIIEEYTRHSNFAFRFGGDEFVAILVETGKDGAILFAQGVCDAMFAHEFKLDNVILSITASAGVTSFPEDGETAEAMLKHADQAMYRAKDKGKNCVVAYERPLPGAAEA